MSDFESEDPEVRRKLTTLLHADVCGYSRLMEQDEVATLRSLKESKSVVAGFLSRHRGRVINWTGDGLLAEFASVVEAVECSAEIQKELGARNSLVENDRRMDFRVGINLGDVMVDGDELYGEGVNIAARLQSIAPVGGVLISGTAFDQVQNKLALEFDFMGRQQVKNISQEIPAYALVLDPDAPVTSRRVSKARHGFDDFRAAATAAAMPFDGAPSGFYLESALEGPFAGFWRRAIAFSIDWSIVLVTCILVSDLTGAEFFIALQVPIYIVYMTGFESGPWQASVGKKIMGIRVVGLDGQPLSLLRSLGRNAGKLLSALTIFIGFMMAGWTERKQALHDRLSEALLVDEDTLAEQQGRPTKMWT
jgi:class 3 adenylate cyclase/uncharacterized RDD family membrane protein YckC